LGIGWSLYSGNPYTFAPSLRVLCYAGGLVGPFHPKIEFDDAFGSLREGKLGFNDATIRIKGSNRSDVDIHIKKAEIVYGKSILDFIRNFEERLKHEIEFQSVHVDGVKGTVELVTSPSKPSDIPNIYVKNLTLQNIQIDVTDHNRKTEQTGPFTLPSFALYSFKGQHIHTNSVVKDILLSSTLLGSLGAGLFSLQRDVEDPDKVIFKTRNLPIGSISKYLKEPFNWFTQATMDSEISDVASGIDHKLDFSIQLCNLSPDLNAPNNKAVYRIALPVLADYINKHNAQIPLNFSVSMQEGELDLKDISQQIAKQIAQKVLMEQRQQLKDGWDNLKVYVRQKMESVK